MTLQGVILCARVKDLPRNPYHLISNIKNCSACGEKVWVARSSMEQLTKNPDLKIICNTCLIEHLKKNPEEPTDFKMTLEAYNEIVSTLGREPDIDNVARSIREKVRNG
jgi:hypothetical protein